MVKAGFAFFGVELHVIEINKGIFPQNNGLEALRTSVMSKFQVQVFTESYEFYGLHRFYFKYSVVHFSFMRVDVFDVISISHILLV